MYIGIIDKTYQYDVTQTDTDEWGNSGVTKNVTLIFHYKLNLVK